MPEAASPGRRFDFIALGRAAVDLYGEQVGGRLEDMASFAKYLGGCPANISVGAARLGLKPAMLTRVGDEHMGRFVRETLAREGVDVSHVRTDPKRLTALVVLGIRDQNTFPLIFYRENCADMAVAPEDFTPEFIASATALLVTGTHFSTAHVDRTSRTAIAYARRAGVKVAFDIDYRPVLWGLTGHGLGEERFVASDNVSAHLQSIVAECDLIVGTEEEIHIAGGSTDTLAALRKLRTLSAATIVLKLGSKGCVVFTGDIPDALDKGVVGPGFPVEVYNVLGAGDGFFAGLLRGWLGGEDWPTTCAYANACGALVVSRHGCAPAMPTWTELEDFLSRARTLHKVHEDERIAYLHRVTTRRKEWPQVCALAFDHRAQFEKLAARHGANEARIRHFKGLIAEAARAAAADVPGAGVIIDDRFGRSVLQAVVGGRFWIARPVERPGDVPLEFEEGPDPALTLRTWPAEQVAKCLVAYHPDDPRELREAQEDRVEELYRACVGTGHELLLEIVPPRRDDGLGPTLVRAMTAFYDREIMPDWWKLPPLGDSASWRSIGNLIRARDPYCRGVLILGIDADEKSLAASFAAASSEPQVKGFAVGRAIFWPTAEAWFAGKINDQTAVASIAQNYARIVELWRTRERTKETVG